jgi:hypothetical protein
LRSFLRPTVTSSILGSYIFFSILSSTIISLCYSLNYLTQWSRVRLSEVNSNQTKKKIFSLSVHI